MADLLDTRTMEMLGQRFVDIIRESLDSTRYPYAPGFDRNAYSGSRPRNSDYKGIGSKKTFGTLWNSVEAVYDPSSQTLGVLMADYWKYVDRGRGPGSYVPIKPLEAWATLKGFPDPTGAAFAISTNIKKFGIVGSQFFSQVASDQIIKEFDEYITEEFGVTIDQFFNALELQGE